VTGRRVREEPLPAGDREAVTTLLSTGYALIDRAPDDAEWTEVGIAFERTIAAMSSAPPDNPQQAAIALGAALGDVVCRITDWEWSRIIRDGEPALAVVSDDRSVCVQPIDVVLDRLVDGADGHIAGLLTALAEGLEFDASPGDYRSLP